MTWSVLLSSCKYSDGEQYDSAIFFHHDLLCSSGDFRNGESTWRNREGKALNCRRRHSVCPPDLAKSMCHLP